MGLGDWIMCTALVREEHEKRRVPVRVVGRRGARQWSEVFEGNPHIAAPDAKRYVVLVQGQGERPYIAAKTAQRWIWRKWKRARGEIYLSDAEREFARPYAGRVLIEPRTKVVGNKDWIPDRWQAVVARSGIEFVQAGSPGVQQLDGVLRVPTTFRQALAILAVSRAFVGTEGALHHAAAALGIPAVVLYSEFISPDITGYDGQRAIRHAGAPCGARYPCNGCRASMAAITVNEVIEQLEAVQ